MQAGDAGELHSKIPQFRVFKYLIDHAKRASYRLLNAVFGHIGRSASEEVVIHLVTQKCQPMLLYGTEASCPSNKSRSLLLVEQINLLLNSCT
jgi:hypothetical protein